VTFEGHSLSGLSADAVARRGLVKTFQTSRPFGSMTFLENVMVGALARGESLSQAQASALEQLEAVGLDQRANVQSSWASTGQRKRLEIARALATRPRLLLLDEPFGGVDLPSIDGLIDVMQRLRAGGITLLVIEHNLEAVHRLVDRLIAMHLGEKIAEGSATSVTADPKVIAAYLGAAAEADA
jgi:branched-chain amino acid transport system ATP-binding protein